MDDYDGWNKEYYWQDDYNEPYGDGDHADLVGGSGYGYLRTFSHYEGNGYTFLVNVYKLKK